MSYKDNRSGAYSKSDQPDVKEKKHLSSRKQAKQDAAYRRWDAAASSKLGKGTTRSEISIEDQAARANAISDIEIPDFFPQNFVSKRTASEKEKPVKSDRKEDVAKGITKLLAGPIEDLVSPTLLPGNEEERARRQAQNFTIMRREIVQNQPLSSR